MFFVRRSGGGEQRFVNVRVGLFFLAAGLWLAGVNIGNTTVTAVAMGVAVLAIVLGLLGRRRHVAETVEEED